MGFGCGYIWWVLGFWIREMWCEWGVGVGCRRVSWLWLFVIKNGIGNWGRV